MSKGTNRPTIVKVILAYLILIFLMRMAGLFLGNGSLLDIALCAGVGLVTLGMYFRNRAAYYVFYIFITISLYGGAVIVLIRSVNTGGAIFSSSAFLVGMALTLIPSAILYRLMDRRDVKAHYLGDFAE